jgi:hypothetical protein
LISLVPMSLGQPAQIVSSQRKLVMSRVAAQLFMRLC